MQISDMIEFVNKISTVEADALFSVDSVTMSEMRDDIVCDSHAEMKKEVKVDKVEGV